jgi:hypothetical protein
MPEPLVTIRRYWSPELAEQDCRVLIDAGITAYGGGYGRGRTTGRAGEVRVPESQVEKALRILPPAEPDLLAPPDEPTLCQWCGSDKPRYPSTLARILSLVGVAAAASLAMRRQFEVAGLVVAFTVTAMYFAKIGSGLVCANCGREWRAPRASDADSEG